MWADHNHPKQVTQLAFTCAESHRRLNAVLLYIKARARELAVVLLRSDHEYRGARHQEAACAYGYSAGVQARRRMLTMLMWIARLYLWGWLPGGKRALFYSINVMRARHPAWFRQDLEQLFGLLATRAIHPRVAERISFDEVAEAHRRLEAGGLEGKLVLCPDLPPRASPAPLP